MTEYCQIIISDFTDCSIMKMCKKLDILWYKFKTFIKSFPSFYTINKGEEEATCKIGNDIFVISNCSHK